MDEGLRSELSKQGIFTTTLEDLYNWGRKNSIWPLGFGLACQVAGFDQKAAQGNGIQVKMRAKGFCPGQQVLVNLALAVDTPGCQAAKMKYERARLKTGLSVSRGTAQCKAPRKALARKP